MNEDLAYVLSVLIFLAGYAGLAALILFTIEGVYRLYCKITGRPY
jgi:hypothetical protein